MSADRTPDAMDRSCPLSRGHHAAPLTPSSPMQVPEPTSAPSAPKSASLRITSALPAPPLLPSPTSSPGTHFQSDLDDFDADALLHDSLFSLSFPDVGSGGIAKADIAKLPLPPTLATTSTSRVLDACSAPFLPTASHGGTSHHYHPYQPMPLQHPLRPHTVLADPHSPFSTLHLPPSPAPSESSAYTSTFPDTDCHSPKAVSSPTVDTVDVVNAHNDLESIAALLHLPAHLTQLARSAIDTYAPTSRPRFSNNQLVAASIICAARALNVNLSMCDTVKACGLSSVDQVRPVVSNLRQKSEALVAIESELDADNSLRASSAMADVMAAQVPLTPSHGGPAPSPRRPSRVASTSRRPSPPARSAAPSYSTFSLLTPAMVSLLALPPEAHKHIEYVFRTSKQQIKLRRGIKGGICGDESILGGAIYFVGKQFGLYPVSQAKVAEAVGRTPTTVKGMFDRLCGLGEDVVPSEFKST